MKTYELEEAKDNVLVDCGEAWLLDTVGGGEDVVADEPLIGEESVREILIAFG